MALHALAGERDAPGLMPRRAPGGPLALVLGVHLLAAWWWLTSSATVAVLPDTGPALRALWLVPQPPPPAPPPPVVKPRPVPRPSIPVRSAPVVPAAATAPAEAIAPLADAIETAPTAPAEQAPDAPVAERARRAAGAADHALRGGKLTPLAPADTPWNRFVRNVEGAHVESNRSVTSESYTAPDGTVIYRFRQGGRVWCRSGGHVRPRLGGAEGGGAEMFDRAGGGGAAGMVACPGQASFKPD